MRDRKKQKKRRLDLRTARFLRKASTPFRADIHAMNSGVAASRQSAAGSCSCELRPQTRSSSPRNHVGRSSAGECSFTQGAFSFLCIQRISRKQLPARSEEHTSELQSRLHIVCRL